MALLLWLRSPPNRFLCWVEAATIHDLVLAITYCKPICASTPAGPMVVTDDGKNDGVTQGHLNGYS